MNLKHKVLTGNPTGDSRFQALTSRALNTSCYFGQSARSIESRCVVKELTSMLDPLLYRGVPPVVIRCMHWTMQMWVLQTWIKAQGLAIVMKYICERQARVFRGSMVVVGPPTTGKSIMARSLNEMGVAL